MSKRKPEGFINLENVRVVFKPALDPRTHGVHEAMGGWGMTFEVPKTVALASGLAEHIDLEVEVPAGRGMFANVYEPGKSLFDQGVPDTYSLSIGAECIPAEYHPHLRINERHGVVGARSKRAPEVGVVMRRPMHLLDYVDRPPEQRRPAEYVDSRGGFKRLKEELDTLSVRNLPRDTIFRDRNLRATIRLTSAREMASRYGVPVDRFFVQLLKVSVVLDG